MQVFKRLSNLQRIIGSTVRRQDRMCKSESCLKSDNQRQSKTACYSSINTLFHWQYLNGSRGDIIGYRSCSSLSVSSLYSTSLSGYNLQDLIILRMASFIYCFVE
ncbi:hypothetical protein O6H91_05G128800 [Diphasiastrum complanatum]|uniref:Uncharacterized protein n=1 Tax=Diphasiastrum complanatum TaxID=34168 RepID=A0ACC2DTN5_DIPCM|nr:hypothetical protein O6H91_05G128800 [Diphasiastrum complanatum]